MSALFSRYPARYKRRRRKSSVSARRSDTPPQVNCKSETIGTGIPFRGTLPWVGLLFALIRFNISRWQTVRTDFNDGNYSVDGWHCTTAMTVRVSSGYLQFATHWCDSKPFTLTTKTPPPYTILLCQDVRTKMHVFIERIPYRLPLHLRVRPVVDRRTLSCFSA